jgi:Uma2 family endonuclease
VELAFESWNNLIVAPRQVTPEQYLEIERKAEYKSEYFNGEMFAMAGASRIHNDLAAVLIWSLKNRLCGRGCKVYPSDMRVRTGPSGLYTYPDVSVVCNKPEFADVLVNPKVVIEILSESTQAHDRGFKFQQYQRIESLEEYVLVDQSQPRIERFYRPPGAEWGEYSDAQGMDGVVKLKSLGIEIPLSEIYGEIEFESTPRR